LKNELADDAALLERALREGWARERAELRALLARRPDWSALLDGPEAVPVPDAAALEQDRRLVNESLALARGSAARSPRTRGGRAPYLRWALAAAAVVAVAASATLWRRDAAEPGADPRILLGEQEDGSDEELRIVLVTPLERVERIESFQWTSQRTLQPGERYLVVLSTVRGDGTKGEELLRRLVDEPRWDPDAFDLVDLPLRLHWSVQRASGGLPSGPAAARLVERSSR
jgi:hypothetical protein